MPNYRRLISYIYAYEGGVKGKNIGFAKIEIRNGQCRIHVNVKRIFLGNSDIGVYLLAPQKEILLGRIFVRNGAGEFRANVSADDVENSGCSMEQCYGLTIHETESTWRTYTTIWEDAVAQAAEVELANVTAQETGTPLKGQEGFSVSEEIRRELEAEDLRENASAPWKEPEIISEESPETKESAAGEEKGTVEGLAEKESEKKMQEEYIEPKDSAKSEKDRETVSSERSEEGQRALSEGLEEGQEALPGGSKEVQGALSGGPEEDREALPGGVEEVQGVLLEESEEEQAVPKDRERTEAQEFRGEEVKADQKEVEEAAQTSEMSKAETSAEDGWKRGTQTEPLWRGGILPEENQNNSGRDSVQEKVLKFAKVLLQGRVPADGEPPKQENIAKEAAQAGSAAETSVRPAPRTKGLAPRPEPGDPARLAELDRLEREEAAKDNIWNQLQRRYAKVLAFDYADGCEILSIKPQDIGMLPRENWIYGNNSFLLHGYYNYRHLILARLENPGGEPRYLLGVPGHYFSNEKNLASMFGFPYFVLAKKQPEQDGRFGYWYTDLRL